MLLLKWLPSKTRGAARARAPDDFERDGGYGLNVCRPFVVFERSVIRRCSANRSSNSLGEGKATSAAKREKRITDRRVYVFVPKSLRSQKKGRKARFNFDVRSYSSRVIVATLHTYFVISICGECSVARVYLPLSLFLKDFSMRTRKVIYARFGNVYKEHSTTVYIPLRSKLLGLFVYYFFFFAQ